MRGHGRPEGLATESASGLARFAYSLEAVIKPIYTWVAYLGAAVMGLLILATTYSVIGRQFGAPLPGSQEITRQSLVLITFLVMGLEHMGHEKMIVDVLVRRLPRVLQKILSPIIYLLGIAILVIADWQLIKWGIKVHSRGQTTMGTLGLPLYPFVFIAAFGILTLIPIYLVRFLVAIDRLVKR